METIIQSDEYLVDDFFLPKSLQPTIPQEDTPTTCYLCGRPSLPSEQGIHAACAQRENLSDDC